MSVRQSCVLAYLEFSPIFRHDIFVFQSEYISAGSYSTQLLYYLTILMFTKQKKYRGYQTKIK